MNDVEKYLFDLQGYLLIDNMLDAAELAALNKLIDDQQLPDPRQEGAKTSFGNYLNWGQPFCDLLDHPKLMSYLKVILGDGFRLDHYYGIYLEAGTGQLRLHGGNTPYDPPEYYHFRNGQMYNGLVVVGWNLTDTGPGIGGFCCIPGSHKCNYPLPKEIAEAHYEANCVVTPAGKAGSVVIFTEALTHGTAPWQAAHPRRSLLFKYSPGQQSWGREYAKPPADIELTPRQRLLFEPPYFYPRPSLFAE
jgi:hypothetical protein